MSKIISIGTALPPYRHKQEDILEFMLDIYRPPEKEIRKIELLYENSGIESRYSFIPDYSEQPGQYTFYPKTPRTSSFPTLETRMEWYHQYAASLSIRAIESCTGQYIDKKDITCLITVSCTGMSAPGLDISIIKQMQLSSSIQHTSLNYMGCYAALHALKLADAICQANEQARVLIVCTELCTLHFQQDYTMDNITSGLLFGDGAAAVLVTGNAHPEKGLKLSGFYSEIALTGEHCMTWELSGKGFLMHLDRIIPLLIKENILPLFQKALQSAQLEKESITRWAVHPGGKKILLNIGHSLELSERQLAPSFNVLRRYGNMSSPTILFVLKEIMKQPGPDDESIFAIAFGPGLTMETLILEPS